MTSPSTQTMMTSHEIRQTFLSFFESKGHKIVPSAPMVVKNDPTLMFTNAGMNPFKDIFLGMVPATYSRIADTQKCLRVSGKHNDLEEVGVDTYHHTMFEMLGNWSFGDYFKADAIQMAWELLTEVYKLPKDRLYVTVFEGDASENLEKDNESAAIWAKYIASDRILLGNKKDNFWEMGDIGPCGPCTEIHFDSRPDAERETVAGATLVNADHPQVIEIWNNVFMEFNRKADSSLEPLPAKSVDTGMGFERLTRVIQGKSSNYDTDIFTPLIRKVESLSKVQYTNSDAKTDIAIRVIVDHIRAISCSIADGQIPSNTGAGYVIRRILRRAVRYGYTYLGFDSPFLFELAAVFADEMRSVFPELVAQKSYIQNVIKEEESSFFRTLSIGIKLFAEKTKNLKANRLDGKDIFELYDTYGFPVDLTKLMAGEQGFEIDEQGFEAELKIQKDRSRNASKTETDDWIEITQSAHSDFIGYDQLESAVKIVRYRRVRTKDGDQYQIVLDKTPFYAESGGQVGDTGRLFTSNDSIVILNTLRENDTIMHLTDTIPEVIASEYHAEVDATKRSATMKNHSATHLLQSALRRVLGDHVQQKGSLVNPSYLRFDFAHFAKMTEAQIAEVETMVNQKIEAQIQGVIEHNIPIDEAKKRGATALFGEKYGESVRLVTFDPAYSMELCGGTHVQNTSDIGFFKILSESSIASGVRRIEATTGQNVIAYYQKIETEMGAIANALKHPQSLITSIQSLQADHTAMRKTIEQYESQIADQEIKRIVNTILEPNMLKVENLTQLAPDVVKNIGLKLKTILTDQAIILAIADGSKWKLNIICGSEWITNGRDDAKKIAQIISTKGQGGGGGQASMATYVGTLPVDLGSLAFEILS